MRAAFTLCGAISHPDRNYHIEIAVPSEALAGFIADQLAAFDIEAKVSERKSKYVVYLKRAEDISDMLLLLGASKAMMAFENVRVKKEVSNRVNRQLNCDNSNINRSMNAAEAQIRDIILYRAELTGSTNAALELLDKLESGLMQLADFPESGTQPRYPALRARGYRVLIIEKYLFFYKIDHSRKSVIIHAAVDGRRDYLNLI